MNVYREEAFRNSRCVLFITIVPYKERHQLRMADRIGTIDAQVRTWRNTDRWLKSWMQEKGLSLSGDCVAAERPKGGPRDHMVDRA